MDNSYYEYEVYSEYPKMVSWVSPEVNEERHRILRSEFDSDEFFNWFLKKYPHVEYQLNKL